MASHGLKDNPASVQAIRDVRAKFQDLFNAKKIQDLCDHFYTDDVALVPPDHDVIHGKQGAKDYFQKHVALGDVAFTLDVIEVHADDVTGYVIGNYVFYDRTGEGRGHRGRAHHRNVSKRAGRIVEMHGRRLARP